MAEIQNEKASSRFIYLAIPFILFVLLAGIFALQLLSGRDKSELPSALIGRSVPQFDLPALSGLKRDNGVLVGGLKSADLKGELTLVNIFASWCGPCRVEHPVLMQLAKRDDISIMGINYKDDPGNALRFLGALGNPYKKVGTDIKGRTAIDWGFYGIPETLLVDGDGIVRHKIVGPITAAKFDGLLKKIEELKVR